MVRWMLSLGALVCGLAVAFGAFGAHALKERLGADLAIYETAVLYQFVHGLAVLIAGALGERAGRGAVWAAYSFLIGIVFFSGSLYILTLSGVRWWGAVTPVGGVLFLVGWGILALSLRPRKTPRDTTSP